MEPRGAQPGLWGRAEAGAAPGRGARAPEEGASLSLGPGGLGGAALGARTSLVVDALRCWPEMPARPQKNGSLGLVGAWFEVVSAEAGENVDGGQKRPLR